jgi:hypothetical protein
MGEFGRSAGGQLPHEEASTREHIEQVGDADRREREAERVTRRPAKRLCWKFWAKRRRA